MSQTADKPAYKYEMPYEVYYIVLNGLKGDAEKVRSHAKTLLDEYSRHGNEKAVQELRKLLYPTDQD